MSGRRNVMVSVIGSLALGVVLLVPASGAGGAPGARLSWGTGSGVGSSDPFAELDPGGSEGQPEGVSKPGRSGLADLDLQEVVEAVLAGSPVDRETAIVRGALVRVEVVARGVTRSRPLARWGAGSEATWVTLPWPTSQPTR